MLHRSIGAIAVALGLAICPTANAQTKADKTVCVAFRTITTATGSIRSTSVAKVACAGAARVDTVTIVRVDTLRPTPAPVPLDPRGYNCWMARDAANPTCIDEAKASALSQTLVLRRYGQTFGFVQWMWKGVIYPTDPSLPGPGTVRVDTVTIVKHDTVTVVRVDTVRVEVPIVTPPAPSRPGAPELPRASVDTRMPVQSLSGDTLYIARGAWWCRGPHCANVLASHAMPMQMGPPAAIPDSSAWILTSAASATDSAAKVGRALMAKRARAVVPSSVKAIKPKRVR